MRRLGPVPPVALLLFGCGVGAPADTPVDELGVVEELRIGGVDGAMEYTFGSVSAVAPAPDGTFYVADRQGPIVRKYDPTGKHLFDVGRRGEGPGEYGSVDGLGVSHDGRLILYDGRNARLSRFSR